MNDEVIVEVTEATEPEVVPEITPEEITTAVEALQAAVGEETVVSTEEEVAEVKADIEEVTA